MEFVVLFVTLNVCLAATNLTARKPPQYDLSDIVETSYEMREEANKIRAEAFELVNRALEIKEETIATREATLSSRSELERSMLETLTLVNTHTAATAQNIAQIKSSLSGITNRLENLEAKVEANVQTTDIIKKRQEVWTSEVRLISLYKMTDQTSTHGGYHSGDLAVNGQFVFTAAVPGSTGMLTHQMTNSNPNNKLNIRLGGLFRIYRVKVWNIRHCCRERLVGTRIYADHRQIGVAVQTKSLYEFDVPEEDPTYARTITLHQELVQYLHVLEVQVWGSGPFLEDDLFA